MDTNGFIGQVLTRLGPINSADIHTRFLDLLDPFASGCLERLGRESFGSLLDEAKGKEILGDKVKDFTIAFRSEPWPSEAESVCAVAANLVRRSLVDLGDSCLVALRLHGSVAATIKQWRFFHEMGSQLSEPAWTAWMLGYYLSFSEADFNGLESRFRPISRTWTLESAAHFAAALLDARVSLNTAFLQSPLPKVGDINFDIEDEVLHKRIKQALSDHHPAKADGFLSFDNPRRWVDSIYERFFSRSRLSDEQRLRFYTLAGIVVAELLQERLEARNTKRNNTTTSNETEDYPTTGPITRRKRRLKRRLERFRNNESVSQVRTVYPLIAYAGRRVGEIAKLLGIETQVAENRVIAVRNIIERNDD